MDAVGSLVEASVISVDGEQVQLDLGEVGKATVPISDFRVRKSETPKVEAGERFEVYIDTITEDGQITASRDRAQRVEALKKIGEIFKKEELVEGEVVSKVEGGFNVDLGVKAFLPDSQFGMRPVRDADAILGQRFQFKIIRYNEERQNVVLSRRALLEAERDKTMSKLKVGNIIEGTVRRFADFGAFVDVGGIEGLLHNDDLTWGRVKHPSEILNLGEPITVKVLKHDKKKRRLSLGLRQIQEDPWQDVNKRYPKGKLVSGAVVSKTDYGCFIEIEPGVEGLVLATPALVSEAGREQLKRAAIGDNLSAEIVEVDSEKKRISLSLKMQDEAK